MFEQLLCHLWGDYLLQSDWMAENKTKDINVAFVHACAYAMPFCFLKASWAALFVIVVTHGLIDRFRLARYLVWAKNWIAPKESIPEYADTIAVTATGFGERAWVPRSSCGLSAEGQRGIAWKRMPFATCAGTGYPPERPVWLTVWLLIIADNTLHLTVNYFALRYL